MFIMYLFLAKLGLDCCLSISLVVVREGYSLAVMHELITVSSLVVGHGL